jgi:hypothetical protein
MDSEGFRNKEKGKRGKRGQEPFLAVVGEKGKKGSGTFSGRCWTIGALVSPCFLTCLPCGVDRKRFLTPFSPKVCVSGFSPATLEEFKASSTLVEPEWRSIRRPVADRA